jgi:hypothetical protein
LFLIVLPFAPSMWGLYCVAPYCLGGKFVPEEGGTAACFIKSAFIAPLAMILGPIAHDEEDPINPWPGVLLTALLLAGLVTVLRAALAAIQQRRATRGG